MPLWRLGLRQYNGITALLPRNSVRYYGLSRSDISARWGKALIETTIIRQILRTPSSPHRAVEVLTNEGAIDLLAFQQGLTKEELFEHISTLAEQDLNDAARYIERLYAPFLANPHEPCHNSRGANCETVSPDFSVTRTPMSNTDPIPMSQNASEKKPVNTQLDFQSMNLGDDEMNLFDPESWLKESPTAQKLWKDGN